MILLVLHCIPTGLKINMLLGLSHLDFLIQRLLVFLQLAWAYVLLSGLSGAALTCYYDDEGNVKLLNILKYGLMLLGLGWSSAAPA